MKEFFSDITYKIFMTWLNYSKKTIAELFKFMICRHEIYQMHTGPGEIS